MERIKVAVFGCGFLGKWHVEKVLAHESASLVAIVEANEESKKRAQELFPELNVVTSLSDIISTIDAGIIVTPTSFHFKLVEELLLAGKHVFCEKPLTDSLLDAKKLLEVSLNTHQVVQVGHSERFHKVWDTIKQKSEFQRFFTEPVSITIDRYAPFKGRATDVDVISDLMIHDLDLLWFLFQERPSAFSAKGHKIQTDKWDHVTAVLSFESGRRAIITSGRSHVEECRKVQIIGDNGTLLINLMDFSFSYAPPGATSDEIVSQSYERADHLYEEQDCFYKAIINQIPPPVSLKDGVEIVSWIEAVQRSIKEGTTVKL